MKTYKNDSCLKIPCYVVSYVSICWGPKSGSSSGPARGVGRRSSAEGGWGLGPEVCATPVTIAFHPFSTANSFVSSNKCPTFSIFEWQSIWVILSLGGNYVVTWGIMYSYIIHFSGNHWQTLPSENIGDTIFLPIWWVLFFVASFKEIVFGLIMIWGNGRVFPRVLFLSARSAHELWALNPAFAQSFLASC